MKGLSKIAILFLLLLAHGVSLGQGLKDDLLKVYEKFNANSFRMEITMDIIHWDNELNQPAVKGEIKRLENNYYTEFDGRISLINENYNVLITENDKRIMYSEIEKNEQVNQSGQINQMMGDTNLFNNSVKLIEESNEGKLYEVAVGQLGIEKMRLTITSKNILQQVIYYYKKSDDNSVKEVVVNYNNVVFNPKFSKSEFSEKTYFKVISGKEFLSNTYQKYTLVKQ